jgi:NADPH2:quinone reductase
MKALVCVEHGPPEKLVVQDLPTPEPGKGEVRIRMHAAGVNFPDVLIIQNLYQFKPPLPFSPGGEAAGVVDAVGEGVTRYKVGDKVIAMIGNGAFREQFLAAQHQVIPIVGDMPFDVAAGFTMTYGTSHHALKQRARLAAGETLLVLGAAGGVGLAAVELGKLMGAKVIAAASSDEKLALCKEYGADDVINYSTEDLKERVKQITGGRGVDVVYDSVGKDTVPGSLDCLRPRGLLVAFGNASGKPDPIDLLTLGQKGSLYATRPSLHVYNHDPAELQESAAALFAMLTAGTLRVAHTTMRLAEVAAAHRLLEARATTGSLVLLP